MSTGVFSISSSETNHGHLHEQWNTRDGAVQGGSIHKVNRTRSDEGAKDKTTFNGIIGSSPALKFVLSEVERVAPTDSTVLVLGETGTGKELIARAIHNLSRRSGSPFIKVNCAAIPLDLLESELFGHEKGAFTGAIAQKIGRFEMADQGTLFLDEIGDLPLALQPKLLRVVQEQEFERLGSGRTHRIDVRLVTATHRDLTEMVSRKEFRSDLYYRLNVFPVELPPLRDRREDIPELISYFVRDLATRMRRPMPKITPETMAAFSSYSWPGNVRELLNLIERAVIRSNGTELSNPLPLLDQTTLSSAKPTTFSFRSGTFTDYMRSLILRTLEDTHWMIGGPDGAAARLGLPRTTLITKMKKLGISRPKIKRVTNTTGEEPEFSATH